jgi:hypothetical protein
MHLAKQLEDQELCARDGAIGHIKDFYFDDQNWHVRYVVVDTGLWLTGRKVLVSSAALSRQPNDAQRLSVDLTKEQVRTVPISTRRNPFPGSMRNSCTTITHGPIIGTGPIWTEG